MRFMTRTPGEVQRMHTPCIVVEEITDEHHQGCRQTRQYPLDRRHENQTESRTKLPPPPIAGWCWPTDRKPDVIQKDHRRPGNRNAVSAQRRCKLSNRTRWILHNKPEGTITMLTTGPSPRLVGIKACCPAACDAVSKERLLLAQSS